MSTERTGSPGPEPHVLDAARVAVLESICAPDASEGHDAARRALEGLPADVLLDVAAHLASVAGRHDVVLHEHEWRIVTAAWGAGQ